MAKAKTGTYQRRGPPPGGQAGKEPEDKRRPHLGSPAAQRSAAPRSPPGMEAGEGHTLLLTQDVSVNCLKFFFFFFKTTNTCCFYNQEATQVNALTQLHCYNVGPWVGFMVLGAPDSAPTLDRTSRSVCGSLAVCFRGWAGGARLARGGRAQPPAPTFP